MKTERTWLKASTLVVQVVLLAAVLASPWFGLPRLDSRLLTTALLYGIAASGLNLMFGYAGMLSLGSAMFMGTGAYTVTIGVQRGQWPVLLAILAGLALSGIVAFLLALVLVRLSGHYFGVATLGLAMAFSGLMIALPDFTGGGSGMTITRSLNLGFVTIASDLQWYVLVILVTACVLLLFGWVVAGKRGRILRLIRQDELAASVLGVPVYWTKVAIFVAGSLFVAVAGSLLVLWQGVVVPDTVGVIPSVQFIALVVIGGAGYRLGGFVGSLIIIWLQALLSGMGHFELVVYGAVFLLVVFFLRPGIEGAVIELWSRFVRLGAGGRGIRVRGQEPAPTPDLQPVTPGPATAGPRPPAPATGLEVREARRTFGGVVAVDKVSVQVRPGSIVGLIGANGAGKSTLLNLISGVESLERGCVLLNDEDVSGLSTADRTRRGIVRTFQVPRLIDALSVVDNIVLGREAVERPVWKRSRAIERTAAADARRALAGVALAELADRPARSLGTGERKYVELVRAVFSDARVLLFDEPAVGLSLEELDELRRWLNEMRLAGTAILVIDHNIDFIRSLADYVCVMESGRVVREGPVGKVGLTGPTPQPMAPGAAPGTSGFETRPGEEDGRRPTRM